MAILRYGQGQDYFNYEQIYEWIETITDSSILRILLFPDLGYGLLNYICITIGLPYEMFMGLFTAATMIMFYVFLKRTCSCSMVALLIFYSVIFMIYPISASRQGFSMAFFLCFMYPLLEKRENKKYYFYLLFISSFHASAIVSGLFPLLYRYKISTKVLISLFCLSFVLMFLKINFFSYIPVPLIQTRMAAYLESSSSQVLAQIVRFLLVFPLFFIPTSLLNEYNEIKMNRILLVCGFFIYALTSFSELASSRLWGYFLGFECIIFSQLSTKLYKFKHKKLMLMYYILIAGILWIKDINGAIQQGEYKNCNVLTYPYVSIFEGSETIELYRKNRGFVNE